MDGFLHFLMLPEMLIVDCIPLTKTKHNFFKNTFFPSAIIEWNKLDLAIRRLKVWVFSKAISSNFLDPPQEVFLIVTTTKELDVSIFSPLSIIWWWSNDSPEHSKQSWLQINRDEWIFFNRNAAIGNSFFDLKKTPSFFLTIHWLHSIY